MNDVPITDTTLLALLADRYPDRPLFLGEIDTVGRLLVELHDLGYLRMGQLAALLQATAAAVRDEEMARPPRSMPGQRYAAAGMVRLALRVARHHPSGGQP